MACGEDPKRNLARQLALAEQALKKGAQDHLHAGAVPLAVLLPGRRPPLLRARRDRSPVRRPTRSRKLAKKYKAVDHRVAVREARRRLYHNTAVVIDADGSLLGIYRKMHIPDDPLYYEKFYFTPGDTGFRRGRPRYATIGVLVCWDQWFPEGARLTAMQGAEILFYPTAIGWHPSEKKQYGQAQHESWELIQRSHASPTAATSARRTASATRSSTTPRASRSTRTASSSGASRSSPRPTARSSSARRSTRKTVLVVDCDLAKVEFSRTHWPFLRDRRIDAYGDADQALQRLALLITSASSSASVPA